MKGYRLVKTGSSDLSKYDNFNNMTELQTFYNKTSKTKEDKLTHYMIRFCNGFEGSPANEIVRKPTNPYIRTHNIKEYK